MALHHSVGLRECRKIQILTLCAESLPRLLPVAMLRRKSTRIALKPEDRDEYFAHKQAGQQRTDQTEQKDKPSEKDARIGLVKPR